MFRKRVGAVKGILVAGKGYAGGNKCSVVGKTRAVVKAVGSGKVVEGIFYWCSTGVGDAKGMIVRAVVVHVSEGSRDER